MKVIVHHDGNPWLGSYYWCPPWDTVYEFSDGSMTFRKHFKRDNGSADGWYAIL